MRALAFVFSGLLGLLGLVFVAGHQGQLMRVVVGVLLMGAAATLVAVTRLQPRVEQRNIFQKLQLGGDVSLEQMKCRRCSGSLDVESIEVKEGAPLVSCPYCGASYQMEEAPKW